MEANPMIRGHILYKQETHLYMHMWEIGHGILVASRGPFN